MYELDVPDRVIAELSQKLVRAVRPRIEGRPVVLIDIPVYFNVGDLLLDWSAEELVRQSRARMVNRVSGYDLPKRWRRHVSSDTVFLYIGGGNFGDLYPKHLQLRMDFLARFPNHPFIFLPQSVQFKEAAMIETARRAFTAHNHLVVNARDAVSHECIQQYFPEVETEMLPDTAVCLNGLVSSDCFGDWILVQRRRDMESDAEDLAASYFDWAYLEQDGDRKQLQKTRRLLANRRWYRNRRGHRLQKALRDMMIARALERFNRFRVVDTDRLHGMVLATLLGKKVMIRNDIYGKVGHYADTWYH